MAPSSGCDRPGGRWLRRATLLQPWTRAPFDRVSEIDRVVSLLRRLARLTASPLSERDNLYIDTDGVRRLSRQIELEQSFGARDFDGWESRLVDLTRDRGLSRTRKGSGYKFGKDVSRTEALAARDELFAALRQFRKDADADLAACLQRELAGATERYQQLKHSTGALDFTDLLARVRTLIASNDDVLSHLRAKFRRIFVDEFQDTDPIQAEILLRLAGDVPRQAVHRRRSEAGDLPLPRDRRRHVLAGLPGTGGARWPRPAADEELS